MPGTIPKAITTNFLGSSPTWYKWIILGFLACNPIVLWTAGPFVAGWLLLGELIFTLALALKCYPLPTGGLLAIEALLLGMTTPEAVYAEITRNLSVILLLVFMVAGIHFMKSLLRYVFSKILLGLRSKVTLSLVFSAASAFLSAFLDALTVIAVVLSVALGLYEVYHRFVSQQREKVSREKEAAPHAEELHRVELRTFRGFLRNLMMHAAVGTALGGVCTLVGEPQNLLIAETMGWHFQEFALRVAPVSLPVFFAGLLTCFLLEKYRLFGYGFQLPETVREVLAQRQAEEDRERTSKQKARLVTQAVGGVILILCLAFHVAEVGMIGLMLIVFLTSMNGITEEHHIGRAFEEGLPFTALLAVFFCLVAMIHDQHLFAPIIDHVLSMEGRAQLLTYYLANGILSVVSDNVFVATVYVSETGRAFAEGRITREQFELLAVAINTGTNIPSIATPNGQAAFLFLLTSAVAPLIRLSYGQMVKLAFPYMVTTTGTGLAAIYLMY